MVGGKSRSTSRRWGENRLNFFFFIRYQLVWSTTFMVTSGRRGGRGAVGQLAGRGAPPRPGARAPKSAAGTPSRPSVWRAANVCRPRVPERPVSTCAPQSRHRRYLPFDSRRGPRARAMAGFDIHRVSTCTLNFTPKSSGVSFRM